MEEPVVGVDEELIQPQQAPAPAAAEVTHGDEEPLNEVKADEAEDNVTAGTEEGLTNLSRVSFN
jgi:hypothetical protein